MINWRESPVVELEEDSARGGSGSGISSSEGSESVATGIHFRRARFIGFGATPRKPLWPPFLNPRIPDIPESEGRGGVDARASEVSAASAERERFTETYSSVLWRFRDEVLRRTTPDPPLASETDFLAIVE